MENPGFHRMRIGQALTASPQAGLSWAFLARGNKIDSATAKPFQFGVFFFVSSFNIYLSGLKISEK